MEIDRRALLISLASSAAMLALPKGAAAAFEQECFAAARKDDRGVYSAALFSLKDGDMRSVELPARGHDITLKPDGGEWVTFARRPGRFGVAIPVDARPPVWFASKPDRHFFGHGAFSADGRLLYSTENDYDGARGVIGVRDATDGYKQIGEFPAHGMEPHDIQLLADGRTMVIANGGIRTRPESADELNLPDMQPSLAYVDVDDRRSPRGAASSARAASDLDSPSRHRFRRHHRLRLPISRPRARRAAARRLPPPRRAAHRRAGAG